MGLYLLFLLLSIYWLLNMSLKTNAEILGSFSFWPRDLTLANYVMILTDSSWYMGYVNSLIYVVENTVISLLVALPAAYAFSRYSFMGDKHLFFWPLTNRMAPPARHPRAPDFRLKCFAFNLRHEIKAKRAHGR